MDEDSVEPSDYTVWYKGLGPDLNKEEIKEYFAVNSRGDMKHCEIVKVLIPLNI